MKCKPHCMITSGFSGSGAFSDGKLTLPSPTSETIEVGGNMAQYLDVEPTKKLMQYTDRIYLKYGADPHVEGVDFEEERREIVRKGKELGITIVDNPIRHLGTEKSHELYKKIQDDLIAAGIEIMFETNVTDLIVKNNFITGVVINEAGSTSSRKVFANRVVVAVGRKGASWLTSMCKKHGILSRAGAIDIGVRYELADDVMKDVNRLYYELKAIGKLPPYYDKVRTFCQNPSGFVASEVYDGIACVNGHSFKDLHSSNTNLALLVSHFFGPMNDPIKYGMNVAENVNQLGNENPVVTRLGDILSGHRTWSLEGNSVVPTLATAQPGDITFVLGYRTMTNILVFIETMGKLIPGFDNPDNLLYAAEVKFYSKEVQIDNCFETSVRGLYCIGDGGGLTRGLLMASASGVQMARNLENEMF